MVDGKGNGMKKSITTGGDEMEMMDVVEDIATEGYLAARGIQ